MVMLNLDVLLVLVILEALYQPNVIIQQLITTFYDNCYISHQHVGDPATGQCLCKPGVFGHHCSKCLDGYYGFSDNGCLACDCHPKGSEDQTCELRNRVKQSIDFMHLSCN